MKIKDEDWNPGYSSNSGWISYEKRWFCNENKIIHQNIKEKQNCKYCKEYGK